MKHLLFSFLLLLHLTSAIGQETKNYFPSKNKWEKVSATIDFDTAKLNDAIRFAIGNESKNPRSMELSQKNTFGKEPFGEAIGSFADRGDATGLIIYKGYIVAEWGEPSRVDMTHSVTKSFLSTVVGLAVNKGLIANTNEKVEKYVPAAIETITNTAEKSTIQLFQTPHNKEITWETMLRQTSDWEGTLWDKPDWADRPDKDSTKWHNRIRNKPGAVFEYNDVRVNALALATMYVWRKGLPEVLKKNIMDPIGASNTWKWEGYKNSWVKLNGKKIQSVSGGGHWGGGMFINAYDMARFGLLTLHKGNWKGKQLIAESWLEKSLTPTTANTGYGYMNFFLNLDKKFLPDAPAAAFVHVGNGVNAIYVDPEHDLVMVVRWIENYTALNGVVKRVLEAMK